MNVNTAPANSFTRRDWWTAAILAVITFGLFAPAIDYPFINYDDPDYVLQNPAVTSGLTAKGIRWAFTAFHTFNWHPLTWLSLQLDATLSKTKDGRPDAHIFHATNNLLHAANAALLFLALRALTGAFWQPAAVSLLFAVHPLRVESVAWISERKDVLSAFFGMLALLAYAVYVRRPGLPRYLAVVALLALSLLAKPMLVTLPFLLLVLDWWPLARAQSLADWRWFVVEKLPLLGLAIAAAIVAFYAQSTGGAVSALQTFPVVIRLANAALSYVTYAAKTVWPSDLAIFYPHRAYVWGTGLSLVEVAGATLLLALLTGAAFVLRRQAPYLLAGWLWYLGTLVPVIGLVQVGGQAYADRYSYFPQVGLLLAACWGVADLLEKWPRLAFASALAAALALASLTVGQLRVWKDSETLWEHALHTTGPTPDALSQLATALAEKGRDADASRRYREALQLDPTNVRARNNLGNALRRQGRLDEAARHLREACDRAPNNALAHMNLGNVLADQGKLDEAADEYEKATSLDPTLADAYRALGLVELRRKRPDRAERCYREALRLQPDDVGTLLALGNALLDQRQSDAALDCAQDALRRIPGSGRARYLMGLVFERRGDWQQAAEQFRQAARLSPELAAQAEKHLRRGGAEPPAGPKR